MMVFGSLGGFKHVFWLAWILCGAFSVLLTHIVCVLWNVSGAYLENWNWELFKTFIISHPILVQASHQCQHEKCRFNFLEQKRHWGLS